MNLQFTDQAVYLLVVFFADSDRSTSVPGPPTGGTYVTCSRNGARYGCGYTTITYTLVTPARRVLVSPGSAGVTPGRGTEITQEFTNVSQGDEFVITIGTGSGAFVEIAFAP